MCKLHALYRLTHLRTPRVAAADYVSTGLRSATTAGLQG